MIRRSHIACIAGLLTLLLAVSCTSQFPLPPLPMVVSTVSPEISPTVEESATSTPPVETAEAQADENTTPESELPIQLMVWTVEAVSAQAEGDAGAVFGRGLAAFENTYPDVQISVMLKNESGKGSVSDYLRTTSQAAPDVLPDVAVLNMVDLAQVARTGLIVPLDGLLSPSLIDDLLPGARAAGTVDGQLMGIPFEMDVEHLIYNTNKVASTPILWTDVISANTTYAFPAKGKNGLVNDAFLIQYLALGGRLQDDEGRPFLDEQALRAALEYYRQGVEAGVIPLEVLTIGSPDEVWPDYVAAQVGMAHVNSHRFLSDKSVLRSTEFASIPTHDGAQLTIGRGRSLVIATHSPNRQAVAAQLIEWLMAPDNNVAWSQATSYLPSRYAAFNLIGDDDPYWPFLQHQLEVAVPAPAFPEYNEIGRVLQQAVIEVLSEEATPEEAAAAAVDAITP
jgi:ABC-type glycerol-3-phosphate transport system substrate-binding protein